MYDSAFLVIGHLYWVYWVVVTVVMARVVLRNHDAVKTLAWIMVFIFVPFLGLMLYFFFGRNTHRRRLYGKRFMAQSGHRGMSGTYGCAAVSVKPGFRPLSVFFENVSSSLLLPFDEADVISDTHLFKEKLFEMLAAARRHIHMQFYIIEDDGFGRCLRDLLVEKARLGVEVRLMYDSVGCWRVKTAFFESMRKAGVCVVSFLEVYFPLFSNRVNYRNHRKIVVVDGKMGMVGGCNVADRYLRGVHGGRWRDTMLLLRGAAVNGLQASFMIDWSFANRTSVNSKRYFLLSGSVVGKSFVQTVASNPIGDVRAIYAGYMKILALAKGYVYLQTPYFMPDEAFLQALRSASLSGVDVRLMIPEHSDSVVADYASMSNLGTLLNSGVKVYLYGGGMLHCKTLVCDDYLSSIGSVNLDFRSLFYNFEVSAFVYDSAVAMKVKETFVDDLKQCRQLSANEYRGRPFVRRCAESLVKLFSPLL